MVIGYARVSTAEQNLHRQIDSLKNIGAEKIFTEKVSGKKSDRPELLKMIEQLRSGDVVVISELTRLSRSTKDLFAIVDKIKEKGADIRSLKETWLDTATPQGALMMTVFAGLSQFEADLTAQRTKEGLAAAKSRGRLGGRPKTCAEKVSRALKMYDSGFSAQEICKSCGISKSTLYNFLGERKVTANSLTVQ
ncbi:MAG: recombinase family protein [Oscillospiraceae bacterium]|nr:recombinase family protein [Oscillospiraceae bacterium]